MRRVIGGGSGLFGGRVGSGFGAKVEVEVVAGDGKGEGVGEDADGVVLTEDEIGEEEQASRDTHIPEDAGKDWTPGFFGSIDLDKPTAGKEEDAEVTDHFPGGDLGAEHFKEDFVHDGST
jgi:hypothetical protein